METTMWLYCTNRPFHQDFLKGSSRATADRRSKNFVLCVCRLCAGHGLWNGANLLVYIQFSDNAGSLHCPSLIQVIISLHKNLPYHGLYIPGELWNLSFSRDQLHVYHVGDLRGTHNLPPNFLTDPQNFWLLPRSVGGIQPRSGSAPSRSLAHTTNYRPNIFSRDLRCHGPDAVAPS